MATYTTNNGIKLISTGDESGTWGDSTNTNLNLIDASLDGQVTITLSTAGTSGSPNDLPVTDGVASNGRNRMIIFTDGGDLGATAYVQLTPNDSEKIVYIRNNLSGSRSILVFQGTYSASNDYEVKAGTTAVIYFDGAGAGAVAANLFNNAYFDGLQLGSVSVTSILDEDNMSSDSATALATQQSIKAYVDAQTTAQDLDYAGDSGTGAVDLDSQTFTISGTANEIETSASGQTLTIGLPSNVTIGTNLTVTADGFIGDDLSLNSDSSILKFGADSEVTLTHIHDTGIRLNTTSALQFRDGAIGINSSVDGQLDIDADTEVEITTTTLDVNAVLDVSGDTTLGGNVDINGTGSLKIPVGTTAQRPGSPTAGDFRWNSTETEAEIYDGSAWGAVGGGNTAVVGWENNVTIQEDYTVTTGNNMMSAGPVTVDTGYSVTVPTGSVWTIV